MDLEKFEKSIKKTGFELEFQVSELLRKQKWTVINNKYYVDDVQGTVREIDLIAYKTCTIESVVVYTVLVISCKKNEQNIWALLSKNKIVNDPNTDWHPISAWSNNRTLEFMLNNHHWKDNYIRLCKENDVYGSLIEPEDHIFAFQEMHKSNGSPQNDKNIFSSISSLMKAEGYEIASLSKRKKGDCLYNFNLISVVDTELVKLHFTSHDVKASRIESDKYIGSYIVNNNNIEARIQFVNIDKLKDIVHNYDALHEVNVRFCAELISEYYRDAITQTIKREIYESDFLKSIHWQVYRLLKMHFKSAVGKEDCWLSWDVGEQRLEINVSLGEGFPPDSEDTIIETLNDDSKLDSHVRRMLKEWFRYEGDYQFSHDAIPF